MAFERSDKARAAILKRLRSQHAPFEDAPPHPTEYRPVTIEPEGDLLERFRVEVERLSGKVYAATDTESAIDFLLGILDSVGEVDSVMGWETLPIPAIGGALSTKGITMTVPLARREGRADVLREIEPIKVGITGADAAFATTGTLALTTRDGQGRLPSLLPPVHIALLPRGSIYPRLEDWLHEDGRYALMQSNSVVFITGPSRTSDIEMQTILGVHGPAELHVIVYG